MKGIEGLTLGRYELRRRVAQGGMAEVYVAYDRRVRRQVAIKVLYGRDESFVRRFEREALAVGALSHDHILPLYDFGEQSPWYYLVMPYVEGGTLREYLYKRKRLTLEEAASFLDQIALALQHAHDHGVVHRDVKPSNILLRPDGYAYLADFGLAKAIMGAESLTSDGTIVGTPEYMAPEQSNGLNDYRSDIYSLGVILYQMLVGHVPFTAESPVAIFLRHIQAQPTPPSELNSDIPPEVEAVMLKALAKDPNERYQEAQELSAAYWKALQKVQMQLGEMDEASVPALIEVEQREKGEETTIVQKNATPGANEETCILPDSERAVMRPPMTPLLFPLINGPESEPGEATTKKDDLEPAALLNDASMSNRMHRIPLRSILLASLILVILSVPLGVLWRAQSAHQIPAVHNTQVPHGRVPQANLTATAQAQLQATQAAQSRAQATAGITSSLGVGNLLYADDMKTSGGGWVDDGSQCAFSSEGYHVKTLGPHEAAWCYSSQHQFSDAIYTAQGQLLQGDFYGLVFRLDPAATSFYVLELNNQGEYRFMRALGRNPQKWLTLIDWTPSSAIQSGYGSTNTFMVIAKGGDFRFYINRQLIKTDFTDNTYASGLIGFLVGGDNNAGTEAVFSNIGIFQK